MRPRRQLWSRLILADIVLFVIASVFNNHNSSSVDGILWWVAIGGFGLLIIAGSVGLLGFLRARVKRPRRPRRT